MAPNRMRPRLLLVALIVGLLGAACGAPVQPAGEEPEPTDPSQAPAQEPDEGDDGEDPPQMLPWGPSEADLDDARATAEELTDEELAGLPIVARYEGTGTEVPAGLVAREGLGGIILFGPNVESLAQVQAVADAVQHAAQEQGQDWPAVIAVDNEGGRVQRLSGASGPWTTFPPFAAAEGAGEELTREAMEAMARELRASGINTNYAPVGDITGPGDAAIGDRSPGTEADGVARAVVAAVEGFERGGVLASVKHFPGHGGLDVDSHDGLPHQAAPISELEGRGFLPFRDAIDAGVPMVMVGHIAVGEWDEAAPASLAPATYDYLRTDLDFTGVTITDGLDMGALEGTSGEIAVRAMTAGADILLTPADAIAAKDGLLEALEEGTLSRDRLVEAASRIIAMMRHQTALAESSGPVGDDDVGASAEIAREFAGD